MSDKSDLYEKYPFLNEMDLSDMGGGLPSVDTPTGGTSDLYEKYPFLNEMDLSDMGGGLPSPKPKEEPSFLDQLGSKFTKGIAETKGSLAAFGGATGLLDSQDTANLLQDLAQREDVESESLNEFMDTVIKESEDIGEAWEDNEKMVAVGEGFGLLGHSLLELVTNPGGAALATAEQAGNMIATLLPGFALGAAGTATPVPLAGPAGFVTGSLLGGTIVETGAAIREGIVEAGGDPNDPETLVAIFENPELLDDIRSKALTKGATTAAVDTAFTLLGLKIVKGATGAASKVARTATASGTEMVGGGVSEVAGQELAYGEVDWAEVGPEVALGAVTGLPEIGAAGAAGVGQLVSKDTVAETVVDTDQTDTVEDSQIVDSIVNAPDTETAIDIMNQVAEGLEVTEDVLHQPRAEEFYPSELRLGKDPFYTSQEAAESAKTKTLETLEGARRAEFERFEAVPPVEGQWRLRKRKPTLSAKPKVEKPRLRIESGKKLEVGTKPKIRIKSKPPVTEGVTIATKTPAIRDLSEAIGVPEGDLKQTSFKPKTEMERKANALVTEALGKKVIFFEDTGGRFDANGVVLKNKPGTIYLNKKANNPHLVVLGHEVMHDIKSSDPQVYRQLKSVLKPMLKDYTPYKQWVNRERKASKLGRVEDDVIVEELIADLMGDSFADARFWNQVEGKNVTVVQKVLEAVQSALNKFIKRLDSKKLAGTGYFKDYIKVRGELAKVIKEHKDGVANETKTVKPVKVEKAKVKSLKKAKKPKIPRDTALLEKQDFADTQLSELVKHEKSGEFVKITSSAQTMYDRTYKRRNIVSEVLRCLDG